MYPHISYIIHYTVPSYHRCIHTYGVRIRDKGITLLYYIKICIPVIWYLSLIYLVWLLDYTYILYTILYSYHNQSRAGNERRQGELLNILVYMIFPGFHFTGKTSRRSHPRYSPLDPFWHQRRPVAGFRLKSQTRVNTCFLPSHYVGSFTLHCPCAFPFPFPLRKDSKETSQPLTNVKLINTLVYSYTVC
jgi:hypothetical protein